MLLNRKVARRKRLSRIIFLFDYAVGSLRCVASDRKQNASLFVGCVDS